MKIGRCSGILLHITSLPGKYGIGDLGPAALAFVDRLVASGQKIWQILPLGPTGYGDSPYAAFSSFAGNELLIDVETLWKDGLLTRSDLSSLLDISHAPVDYGRLVNRKLPLLRKAAATFQRREFLARERHWLDDYALFRSIKAVHEAAAQAQGGGVSIWNLAWPVALQQRRPEALEDWRASHADEVESYRIQQFFFFRQWEALKAYANRHGVAIVGDLPIFAALDSADVWAAPEFFQLDKHLQPLAVAGVPPDYFSADGQLWGNPLYDWPAHRRQAFAWWTSRLRQALRWYDMVRIDHFRGFEAYWAVPAGARTARHGRWEKAPGRELFTALQRELGVDLPIIAEDLGVITDEVRSLRDDFGLPGMRILQFAFGCGPDGRSLDASNSFLPHNYVENCVAYTGTHDNDTLVGRYVSPEGDLPADQDAARRELALVHDYLGWQPKNLCAALVREILRSVARVAILPAQDILESGRETRMNTPSTLGRNWSWRLRPRDLKSKAWDRLQGLCRLYSR